MLNFLVIFEYFFLRLVKNDYGFNDDMSYLAKKEGNTLAPKFQSFEIINEFLAIYIYSIRYSYSKRGINTQK